MIDQELLIQVVREQRLLWDKRHKNYRNRLLTKRAWKAVAEGLGCTSDEAQSKWKNLRDSFSRELKKIPKSRSGADAEDVAEYTGDWLHFEAMQFLKGVIRPRKTPKTVRTISHEETDTVDEESVMSNSTGVSSNTDNQTHLQQELENFTTQFIPEIQFGSNQSIAAPTDSLLSPDIISQNYSTYGLAHIAGSHDTRQNDFAKMFADLERQKIDLLKKEIEFQEDEDMNWFKSILPHLRTLPSLNKFLFRTKVQEMLFNELTKVTSLEPGVAGPSTMQNSLTLLQ